MIVRGLPLLLLIWLVPLTTKGGTDGLPAKIQPTEIVGSLDLKSDQQLDFIVRGTAEGLKAAQDAVPANLGHPDPLPFIDGLGISLKLSQAVGLAKQEGITQIWYVSSTLYPTYKRIIEGIEHAAKTLPATSLINMSLGPPADALPLAGHDEEPMNAATKKAADAGLIIVMAIGNYNDGENNGMVNPWCHPIWIICVGAASADAKSVWYGSARGLDSDPRTWPDVVANGIDVISTWPSGLGKSDNRRKYDEANPLFQKTVPKEKWAHYTMDSGTSEATPQVSRAAAQIVSFIRNILANRPSNKLGDKLFAIEVPADHLTATTRKGPRLTGDLEKEADPTKIEITYRLVEPWKLVKQILIDTSVPMPDFPPSVVGAGFVDPTYIEKQFPTPEKNKVEIEPIKVL